MRAILNAPRNVSPQLLSLSVDTPLVAVGNTACNARNPPEYLDAEFGPEFRLSDGISAQTNVELQMTAEGRASFGEKLRFILTP